MFKTTVKDYINQKNTVLSVFTKTVEKLNKLAADLQAQKDQSETEVSKLSAEIQLADAEIKSIATTVSKIQGLVG